MGSNHDQHDIRLIQLVREHPALYDSHHGRYRDLAHRRQIWIRIGEAMGEDGTTSKKRWNNIRDQYRKRNKDHRGAPRYRFGELLAFLEGHGDEPDHESPSVMEMFAICRENHQGRTSRFIVNFREHFQHWLPPASDAEAAVPELPGAPAAPTAPPVSPTAGPSRQVSMANASTELSPQHYNRESVDAFLAGIAPMLYGLSPELWATARAELFEVAQKFDHTMRDAPLKTATHLCQPGLEEV